MIGAKFKYPETDDIFILKEVTGHIYRFECGHWVTNLIFKDLIQLTLF